MGHHDCQPFPNYSFQFLLLIIIPIYIDSEEYVICQVIDLNKAFDFSLIVQQIWDFANDMLFNIFMVFQISRLGWWYLNVAIAIFTVFVWEFKFIAYFRIWNKIAKDFVLIHDFIHHRQGKTHYNDVIMSAMASQITSLMIVFSTIYSVPDQRKHQSSASLAIVRGTHRLSMNSPHTGPVTPKMFPLDDVTMRYKYHNVTTAWVCHWHSQNMIYSSPNTCAHNTFEIHCPLFERFRFVKLWFHIKR